MQTIINTDKNPITKIPKSVQTPVTISWVIFVVLLGLSIIYYFIAQPQLPLLYTVASKSDQLVDKIFIFIFPALSFVMNIVHYVIARLLKKFSIILLKLFVGTTLGLQVILLFAFLRIILITI